MYQMYRAGSVGVFYPYVFGYFIAYMPTIALANSVSFRQMTNPEKEFSVIRLLGSFSWIVTGWLISYIFHWDSDAASKGGMLKYTFLMSAIASLVLGLYSFTLPKTPPVKSKEQAGSIAEILGLDAVKLLANKNFLIFFISSILICIPLSFYYQNAHTFLEDVKLSNPAGKMGIGQISEVLCILLIPFFFSRFGFKKTIILGMLAWAVRYMLFAYGNGGSLTFMLIIGIALHGICYDFFFISGQIYTNTKAGEKYKSSAQGLITLATYGVGMMIGFWVAGFVSNYYKNGAASDWVNIWRIPAIIAFVVLILFILFFKDERKSNAAN
jgi:nucleoside transporter